MQPALTSLERDGARRHLEPKVMQVLVHLAGQPGDVMSKEQLIDAVWGDVFVAEGVLVRSVSELRRALEDDAKNPRYIETIPKMGYRLIAPVSFDVDTTASKAADTSQFQPPAAGGEVEDATGRKGGARAIQTGILLLSIPGALALAIALYATWDHRLDATTSTPVPTMAGVVAPEAPAEEFSAARLHQRGYEFFQRYRRADNVNAIELFKRALELDPTYAQAYAGLAEAYAFKVMRYAEAPKWSIPALDAARKSVDLEPESGFAHRALGLALLVHGRVSQAREELHRADELETERLSRSLTAHYLGMAHAASGRLEDAAGWYEKALELDDGNALLLASMGHVFRLLGDLRKAETWYHRSLEIEPFQMEARLGLAELALVQGDVIGARQGLRQYLEVEPEHALALTLWARAEVVGSDSRLAQSLCRRALASASESGGLGARLLLASILGHQDEEGRGLLEALAFEQQPRLDVGSEAWQPHWLQAGVHVQRKDHEAALDALRVAVEAGFRDYLGLAADPIFTPLDAEPKFRQLLQELDIRVGEMRRRIDNP